MRSQPANHRPLEPTGYLTVAEVALVLGVAKSFVYRRTGPHHPDPIPCFRFGGHLRFLASDVEEWASAHRKRQEVPHEAPPARLVALDRRHSGGRIRLRVREPRS